MLGRGNMRKYLILLGVLFTVFILGCAASNSSAQDTNNKEKTTNTQAKEKPTPKIMCIQINDKIFEVLLYDTNATQSLIKTLPQKISMSRWGDEFYGKLNHTVDYSGDGLRDVFEVGEVALWPQGNALCIFFGPTPASKGTEPRMASKGAPFGKIIGDAKELAKYEAGLNAVNVYLK